MGLWEISTNSGSTYTDLATLYFYVSSSAGTGMIPVKNIATPLPLQAGSQYDKTSIQERPFSLRGSFNTATDATKANFHSRKATLLQALNANAGTKINTRPEPIYLKYTGATADKIIKCYYEGGFEDSSPEDDAFSQKDITLRFVAFDPFFYATSESNTTLDNQDSATFTTVAGKISGLWDNLGPPNAAGTYTSVGAIVSDDTYIYIGGTFSNFDNIANADGIVRMNRSTQAYSAMGTGVATGAVLDLALDAAGNLYAVGTFTNMGGVAAADNIATWNGTAWSALGTPASGATITTVDAVDVSPDGKVYVGGDFLNLAGVAAADYAATWNGTAWSALGTGPNARVRDIIAAAADKVYYLGEFTSANSVSDTELAAYWNGTTFVSMGAGSTTGIIRDGAIDAGGVVYVGGTITSIGGASVTRVAKYNGTSWTDVGGGVNSTAAEMVFAPDGNLYVGGAFTQAGSSVVSDGIAIWNGSVWARIDANFSGSPDVTAIHFDASDDLYIGFDTDGTGTYAGNATVAYAGTSIAYPYVTIKRSGGTSDKVYRLENIATGAVIYLDYDLSDGETLTLDFRPFSTTPLSATSDYFGAVPEAIQGGSDTGNFYLTPGRSGASNNNVISLYVEQNGGPTTTATIYYTAAYLSMD